LVDAKAKVGTNTHSNAAKTRFIKMLSCEVEPLYRSSRDQAIIFLDLATLSLS
jgi:hypothetical protein